MRKGNVGVVGAVVALGALWSAEVSAFGSFPSQIPNGTTYQCSTCHLNPNGGGARNPFGMAFRANNYLWDATLCNADSDGDGASNGVELGDANCDGAADVPRALSRPGDIASRPCGNGTVEGSELCDGSNLNGATCASEGFAGGGVLACASSCAAFDTSGCSASPGPDMDAPDMDAPDMDPPDMPVTPDMAPDMPEPLDMPADMPPVDDMPGATDMPPADDMPGVDLGDGDMSGVPGDDMSATPDDMAAAADMDADMGAGADMSAPADMSAGTGTISGGAGGDDEGCAQAGLASPSRTAPGALLALLGLLGLARRRRASI